MEPSVMETIMKILPFFIPVLIVQVTLQIYCIVNLVHRKKVRFNSKLLWGVIIIALELAGPVLYLLLRGDEE
jgi:heme/copper-type cytochrome/quinol oxidase subunit 4